MSVLEVLLVLGALAVYGLRKLDIDLVKLLHNRYPMLGRMSGSLNRGTRGLIRGSHAVTAGATHLLAWLWVGGVVLTLADWFTPLEMASGFLRSIAHASSLLLALPAAKRFGWSFRWPLLVWLSCLALFVVSLVVWPLLSISLGLFLPVQNWQTDFIYEQRGRETRERQLQRGTDAARFVQIRPLTPFFRWVTPWLDQNTGATPASETGWTPVNRPPARPAGFSGASRARGFADCQERQKFLDDSLRRMGQPPAFVLPARTQRGANTIGWQLAGRPWSSRGSGTGAEPCRSGLLATWKKARRPHHYDLRVQARPCVGADCRMLYLAVYDVSGPGTYALGRYDARTRTINGSFLRLSDSGGFYLSQPSSVTLTITRFDTVAQVVAGTFRGYLVNGALSDSTVQLQEGRLDIHFEPPPAAP